jgi:hypothetical protein
MNGNLSQQAQEVEHAPEFIKARRAHSAVESAINALEVHGLDKCLVTHLLAVKKNSAGHNYKIASSRSGTNYFIFKL